jgi:hypothetical protein
MDIKQILPFVLKTMGLFFMQAQSQKPFCASTKPKAFLCKHKAKSLFVQAQSLLTF